MKNIVICKFGGARLSTPEKLQDAAEQVKKLKAQGKNIIVVVSAQGDTTDDLLNLAYKTQPKPSRRELDMLLTAGERISISLMSMALQEIGIDAISFTGSQAGIFSDSHHGNARIKEIKPIRVSEELQKNKVVVVAGFQAVNPETKEITTLGRGGSDTTAIALAAYFNAESCYMFKNVEGVQTMDPKIYKEAQKIEKMNYKNLKSICFSGAQILHYRCVALAEKLNIKIRIGKKPESATLITEQETPLEGSRILSINSHKVVQTFEFTKNNKLNDFLNWCENQKIPSPQILASNLSTSQKRMMITGDSNILNSIEKLLDSPDCPIKKNGSNSCSITITCPDSTHPHVLKDALEKINLLNLEKTIASSDGISFFFPADQHEQVLQKLSELL